MVTVFKAFQRIIEVIFKFGVCVSSGMEAFEKKLADVVEVF